MCRLLLADLDHSLNILHKSFHDPLFEANPDVSITVFEAQAFAIFDITVLSHMAKSSKEIIGVIIRL